jgi:hypothetical protein
MRNLAFSLVLSCLVSGCGATQQSPAPQGMTPQDPLAAVKPRVDCEYAAATRYDDGSITTAALAQQMLDVCGVEVLAAERAFHVSSNDPDIKADEFKEAVGIAENARKNRVGRK